MSSLPAKIGHLIPNGAFKEVIRAAVFPFLFATSSTRQVLIGPSNDKIPATVSRLIFTTESLSEREMDGYLQYYHPAPGDIVVNAGAYHGYFGIYLSRRVGPTGHVICFEPETNNYQLLSKNIALNDLSNVTLINKGLWHTTARLPITTRGSGSSLIYSGWTGQTADVCRLDEEFDQLGFPPPDFIAMDIEGAEIAALAGCSNLLKQKPSLKFAIASYHVVDGSPTWPNLESQFKAFHLAAKTSFPRHLTTYAQSEPFLDNSNPSAAF